MAAAIVERWLLRRPLNKSKCMDCPLGRNKEAVVEGWPLLRVLTLSLPECLIEFCKVTLTFDSVDKILWCDHSNESSLPLLSHDTILFLEILENEIWKFCRNLPLATFDSERVKPVLIYLKGAKKAA